MNFLTKMLLIGQFLICAQISAGVLYLNSLVPSSQGEAVVRKVMLEYITNHSKVVFYFGKDGCTPCKKTKDAIEALISKFPDVIFVMVDLAQYGYLKSATWPRLRFYKNGIFLIETKSKETAELQALLNTYYR